MVIQCREEMFNLICDIMQKQNKVPSIIEESGGHIDCFDKGWIFIKLSDFVDEDIMNLFVYSEGQYVFGIDEYTSLGQQKVAENEQYIWIRKYDDTYKVVWAASSYIVFREEQKNGTCH